MAVLYSPMGGLYAHISSSAQLFAPEYQHHPKVDLRRPFGRVDFGLTSVACMHAIRRDPTTITGCDSREKLHELSDHVWRAWHPLVIVNRCYGRRRDRRRMEALIGENGYKTKDQLPNYGSCAC